jgi:hypothetical protein
MIRIGMETCRFFSITWQYGAGGTRGGGGMAFRPGGGMTASMVEDTGIITRSETSQGPEA